MRVAAAVLLAVLALPAPAVQAHHAESYTQVIEPGFAITPYAIGAASPTALAFGPDGHLYVATVAGTVFRFRDIAGVVGGPPEPFVEGLDYPLGLAWSPDGHLYVSSIAPGGPTDDREWGMVTRYAVGTLGEALPLGPVLVDLPQGHSQTNGLTFGPDGKLYVANGSSTDDGVTGGPPDVLPLSGSVVRLDPADAADGPLSAMAYRGSGVPSEDPVDVVAVGLRNNYDLDFRGEDLMLTMNGPETTDPFGDDLLLRVPDARTSSLADGTAPDFGFPGCLYTHDDKLRPIGHPSPHPLLPDELKSCDGVRPPVASLGLHPSANGVAIAPDGFGPFGGDAFIAEWGSFSGVRGHKIARVGLTAEGEARVGPDDALEVEDFVLVSAPIDLVFRGDAMYIADFGSGSVLRVVSL